MIYIINKKKKGENKMYTILQKPKKLISVCEYDNPIQWIKGEEETFGEVSITSLTFLVDSFFQQLSILTITKDSKIPTLPRMFWKVLDLYENEDKQFILDAYRNSDKFILFIADEIETFLGYDRQLWLLFLGQYFREWEEFEDNLDREKCYE